MLTGRSYISIEWGIDTPPKPHSLVKPYKLTPYLNIVYFIICYPMGFSISFTNLCALRYTYRYIISNICL